MKTIEVNKIRVIDYNGNSWLGVVGTVDGVTGLTGVEFTDLTEGFKTYIKANNLDELTIQEFSAMTAWTGRELAPKEVLNFNYYISLMKEVQSKAVEHIENQAFDYLF